MPQFSRSLDVYQGFNFKKDKQNPVGFITKLTIGDITFTANLECKDPTAPTTAVQAVCVLNSFLWETGTTDPLNFSGQINLTNKQAVLEKLLAGFTDMSVTVNYTIYEYDQVAKKYYKSMAVDSDLTGILEKRGEDLNMNVADDASTEVQSPKNFAFMFACKPTTSAAQSINVATGDGKKVVKQWGIKES